MAKQQQKGNTQRRGKIKMLGFWLSVYDENGNSREGLRRVEDVSREMTISIERRRICHSSAVIPWPDSSNIY